MASSDNAKAARAGISATWPTQAMVLENMRDMPTGVDETTCKPALSSHSRRHDDVEAQDGLLR